MVEVISKSISMRGTDSDNVSFYEIVVNISHTIIEAASVNIESRVGTRDMAT